jgi:hypothetical protein
MERADIVNETLSGFLGEFARTEGQKGGVGVNPVGVGILTVHLRQPDSPNSLLFACSSGSEKYERQVVESSYQRGSRNPGPPDPLAFWRRYSAYVPSARFSSETDFCSRAVVCGLQTRRRHSNSQINQRDGSSTCNHRCTDDDSSCRGGTENRHHKRSSPRHRLRHPQTPWN